MECDGEETGWQQGGGGGGRTRMKVTFTISRHRYTQNLGFIARWHYWVTLNLFPNFWFNVCWDFGGRTLPPLTPWITTTAITSFGWKVTSLSAQGEDQAACQCQVLRYGRRTWHYSFPHGKNSANGNGKKMPSVWYLFKGLAWSRSERSSRPVPRRTLWAWRSSLLQMAPLSTTEDGCRRRLTSGPRLNMSMNSDSLSRSLDLEDPVHESTGCAYSLWLFVPPCTRNQVISCALSVYVAAQWGTQEDIAEHCQELTRQRVKVLFCPRRDFLANRVKKNREGWHEGFFFSPRGTFEAQTLKRERKGRIQRCLLPPFLLQLAGPDIFFLSLSFRPIKPILLDHRRINFAGAPARTGIPQSGCARVRVYVTQSEGKRHDTDSRDSILPRAETCHENRWGLQAWEGRCRMHCGPGLPGVCCKGQDKRERKVLIRRFKVAL